MRYLGMDKGTAYYCYEFAVPNLSNTLPETRQKIINEYRNMVAVNRIGFRFSNCVTVHKMKHILNKDLILAFNIIIKHKLMDSLDAAVRTQIGNYIRLLNYSMMDVRQIRSDLFAEA